MMPRFRGTRYPLMCRRDTAFSPLSLSNLALWLDPTYGLYQERTGASATTAASADADPVGTWAGRRNTAAGDVYCVAANDAKRPALRTAYVNSYNAVSFDGTDDFLTFSGYTPPSVWTLIVAMRDSGVSVNNVNIGGDAGGNRYLNYPSNNAARLFTSAAVDVALTRTNWNIIGATNNAAASKMRANAGSVTTGDAGSASWSGFSLGATLSGVYATTVQFAGLALYEGVLSDADCALVMAYFNARVGVY